VKKRGKKESVNSGGGAVVVLASSGLNVRTPREKKRSMLKFFFPLLREGRTPPERTEGPSVACDSAISSRSAERGREKEW